MFLTPRFCPHLRLEDGILPRGRKREALFPEERDRNDHLNYLLSIQKLETKKYRPDSGGGNIVWKSEQFLEDEAKKLLEELLPVKKTAKVQSYAQPGQEKSEFCFA